MTIRMLWFLPIGVATGMGGLNTARHLLHQGGKRHRTEAVFITLLTWLPLAVWLLNQFNHFER